MSDGCMAWIPSIAITPQGAPERRILPFRSPSSLLLSLGCITSALTSPDTSGPTTASATSPADLRRASPTRSDPTNAL
eukprot:CAMPEP_0174734464 /NCGR_PEP_ID=MMETSP1094-20130205/63386_1 /TAXON_ID=156173 /ORGANISM="Chrysochromulina brevifilum, Strain UTEX LB 985" /LENGTH=77 /DNA_ID=CAMNT_0015937285 /DNA_START=129 /DNA_END=359 /DNA_ORIENTATION=+